MKRFLLLGVLAGAMAVPAAAHAGGVFSLHVGVPGVSVSIGVPPPIVVRPAPVYAPPAVVVAPPVYVRPRRVVVPARRVVLVPPPPVVVYRPHYRYVAAPYCY